MEHTSQEEKSFSSFNFGSSGRDSCSEVKEYLRKLVEINEEPSQQVILEIANDQLLLNATVLSALSPYWSNLIGRSTQDAPVIYKVSPVTSHESYKLLPLIKSLIYCGIVSLPLLYVDDIMAIIQELHLEASNFVLIKSTNEAGNIRWENHFDELMKGLQTLCSKQQCTDLSIYVESCVMKVHRLILCSYSNVLHDLFQENSKIKILHIPGISIRSVCSLLKYMYYGSGSIPSPDIDEFGKLCKSLKVHVLSDVVQMHQSESKADQKISEKKGNVFTTMEPEIALAVKRLLLMFDIKGKTDLTLVVGNKRIYTHKSLLGMTCPAFHSLLKEENSNEQSSILILDADAVSITALITLLYCGSCWMNNSQMKVISSYLDSGLFKLHMSDSSNIGRVLQNDGGIKRRRRRSYIASSEFPKRSSRTNTSEAIETDDISTSKYEVLTEDDSMKDIQLAMSGDGNIATTQRMKNQLDQVDEANRDSMLPAKRYRRLKSYNCEEWVTGNSVMEAACQKRKGLKNSSIPEKPFTCNLCVKGFSSKSSLNRHMRCHGNETLSDSSVCTNIKMRRGTYNRMKSRGTNQKHTRGRNLERYRKVKHCHEEIVGLTAADVNEDTEVDQVGQIDTDSTRVNEDIKIDKRDHKIIKYEDLPITQVLPSNSMENHKRKNCVPFFKKFSPQKDKKGSPLDPLKLSEGGSLSWTCDICSFQCSTYQNLKQHERDFHVNEAKEIVYEASESHLSEPFKSGCTNEFQLDKNSSFSCPECGECFNSLESFSAHAQLKGHAGIHGPCWVCGVCDAVFSEENELNEHLISHNPVAEDTARSDNDERPVTILDQQIPSDINGFLQLEDIADGISKNEFNSFDKVEADSSVLDSESTVISDPLNNKYDATSDVAVNNVTSSVNEKAYVDESVYSQIQQQFDQMFGNLE